MNARVDENLIGSTGLVFSFALPVDKFNSERVQNNLEAQPNL